MAAGADAGFFPDTVRTSTRIAAAQQRVDEILALNVEASTRLQAAITRCAEALEAARRSKEARESRSLTASARGAPLRYDATTMLVTHPTGRKDILTPTEWRLLRLLSEHPGRTFTRSELARRLWGMAEGRGSEVEVYVSRLRRKLGADDGELIETVRGRGYRLRQRQPAPASALPAAR